MKPEDVKVGDVFKTRRSGRQIKVTKIYRRLGKLRAKFYDVVKQRQLLADSTLITLLEVADLIERDGVPCSVPSPEHSVARSIRCDCGGAAIQSTHSHWCSLNQKVG